MAVIYSVEWLNISYNDPAVKRRVDGICGKSFGLWESIRMGGSGSPRMLLRDASHGLLDPFDRLEDRRTCSLELRKAGILLHCRSRLETMGLPIGNKSLAEIILRVAGAEQQGELLIRIHSGATLRLEVHPEHWTALSKILRKGIQEGRFRTKGNAN